MEKVSLNKFTHIPLFKKNDAQLKPKIYKKPKKKKIKHQNLLKNKIHVHKKKITSKQQQKKKKKKKEAGNVGKK